MSMYIILILFVAVGLTEQQKSDEGYEIFEVIPRDEQALKSLIVLRKHPELDFWTKRTELQKESTVMVPSNLVEIFKLALKNNNIEYRIVTEYWQEQSHEEAKSLTERIQKRSSAEFDLNNFNTLSEIQQWLDVTVRNCNRNIECSKRTEALTYEQNNIDVLKIRLKGPPRNKKAIWIDGTTHAREWLSPATILKIIDNFANVRDKDVMRLLELYDWYFAPVINPDGYAYSWTKRHRMWRKNRKPHRHSHCVGVDLNRNFNFHWGEDNNDSSPCSVTYRGEKPNSEQEVKVVAKAAQILSPNLEAWISLHSYGNYWLFPYGHLIDENKCAISPDHDELMRVANAAADAAETRHGTSWTRGNSCRQIYSTAGTGASYVKGVLGVKYAYTVEVRGDNFTINPSEIQLSFEEIWSGIVAMVDAINNR